MVTFGNAWLDTVKQRLDDNHDELELIDENCFDEKNYEFADDENSEEQCSPGLVGASFGNFSRPKADLAIIAGMSLSFR